MIGLFKAKACGRNVAGFFYAGATKSLAGNLYRASANARIAYLIPLF